MPFGVARANFREPSMYPGENAKVTAWVVSVGAANVSYTRRRRLSEMMDGLDGAKLTSTLARLWIFAAENSTCALVDLIGLNSATLTNAPTFTANQGYAGNGSTSYVNTGSASAGTQNASTFGFYNRTNQAAADVTCMGNLSGTSNSSNVSLDWSDGKTYFSCNDDDSHVGFTAPTNRTGIYINSRTSSTVATLYRNGASLGTNGETSTGASANTYLVGACNGSSPLNHTTNQIGMAFLGNTGWTAAQALAFNSNIQTYMTAIGA